MPRLFKIPTPIAADPRFVELCQEVFRISCRRRALVEAAGGWIDLYFERLSDATACVDLVEDLVEQISSNPSADSTANLSSAGARARL